MTEIFIQEIDCETGEITRRSLTSEEQIEFDQHAAETLAIQINMNLEEVNEKTIRDQLLTGLITIETHLTNLAAASPTPAQQKAALIFSLKASKQLARLILRVLDSTD